MGVRLNSVDLLYCIHMCVILGKRGKEGGMEVQRDRGTEVGRGGREKKGWRNRGTGGGREGGREIQGQVV